MTRQEILDHVRSYMAELFDTPAEAVTPDAKLVDDLDLDSIDAVDLIVKLQQLIGRKIRPEEFRTVRTVGDIIDRVHSLANA